MGRKRQKWFGADVIYEGEGASTRVVLIRHQDGRIGFPGGMRTGDKNPQMTSGRETREETKLKREKDAVPEAVYTFPGVGHLKVFHLFHKSAYQGEVFTEPHYDGKEVIQAFWEYLDEAILVLSYAHRAAAEDFSRHMGLMG